MKKSQDKNIHLTHTIGFDLVPDISSKHDMIYLHLEALKITESNDGVVTDYQKA